MNAFSDAIYRTHPSNKPSFCSQVWDNAEIATFFKNFTQIFVDLGDYRMRLMKEHEQTGIPITRSLMMEFNNTDIHIDDQFMLGSEIMMAPVFKQGHTSRKVFFPTGEWKHYLTNEVIISEGTVGEYREIDAPLGIPAVFKKVMELRPI